MPAFVSLFNHFLMFFLTELNSSCESNLLHYKERWASSSPLVLWRWGARVLHCVFCLAVVDFWRVETWLWIMPQRGLLCRAHARPMYSTTVVVWSAFPQLALFLFPLLHFQSLPISIKREVAWFFRHDAHTPLSGGSVGRRARNR